MTRYSFQYDARLGIDIPSFLVEWDGYTLEEQAEILERWEAIRGNIPALVQKLDREIVLKQNVLDHEDDFLTACRLTWEIADLASIINDLHLWFRVNQEIDGKSHQ